MGDLGDVVKITLNVLFHFLYFSFENFICKVFNILYFSPLKQIYNYNKIYYYIFMMQLHHKNISGPKTTFLYCSPLPLFTAPRVSSSHVGSPSAH